MTYESSAYLIWRGFGSFAAAGFDFGCSSISSSMISWQRVMHSSQMYTPCPAISFRTCSWLLPQNEQRYGTLLPLLLPVVLTTVRSALRLLRLGELRLRTSALRGIRVGHARPLATDEAGVVGLGDQ